MHQYRILELYEVSPNDRILGQEVTEASARYLKMDPANLHFIRETQLDAEFFMERPVLGLQRQRNIYIVENLSARELLSVVSHETRHVFSYDKYETRFLEQRARLFAFEFSDLFRSTTPVELFKELFEFGQSLRTHDIRQIGGMRLITPNERTMQESLRRQILGNNK
jgi:hypothetical protein